MEMITAAGDTCVTMIIDLATAITRDGKAPTDWEQRFIVCLYKDKGDAPGQRQLSRPQAV